MLMLNPAMASEYLAKMASFLYARLVKVERSVLGYSAVSIQTGTCYFMSSYLPPEEQLVAHGNVVLFLCQDVISKCNNRCIHLHVRPTVMHVNAYYFFELLKIM